MKSANRITGIIFLLVMIFSIHGCTPYYAFGNGGIDPITFNKPIYADSEKVTTYVGGKFTQSLDSAYFHNGEKNSFGQIYLAQTFTEKYYNFSYGAFGYLGSYHVVEVPDYNGNKSYYGGGLSCEFNFNLPFKTLDVRLIGLKGTLIYEDGDFTRFRSLASEQNLIVGVTHSRFEYNISLVNGFDFKVDKGKLGLDLSEGITHFNHDIPEFLTSSMNIHYTFKQYTAFLQFTNSFFGIGEEFALGFNYRIKYR